MAHIKLPEGAQGISGPLRQFPETGQHLLGLAQALLRGQSPLTVAEREVIATYVSSLNGCVFCTGSHGAAARFLLKEDAGLVEKVKKDPESAPISDKLKALLAIAARVQQGGNRVTDANIARARTAGANDKAIHDAVLIAAAFCMYNRYVDGLATPAPGDPAAYDRMGQHLAEEGYL